MRDGGRIQSAIVQIDGQIARYALRAYVAERKDAALHLVEPIERELGVEAFDTAQDIALAGRRGHDGELALNSPALEYVAVPAQEIIWNVFRQRSTVFRYRLLEMHVAPVFS